MHENPRGALIGSRSKLISFFGFTLLFLLLASSALAVTDLTVFGPERYERQKGAPTVYTDTFERCEPSDLAVLRVWNGDSKESRITSAEIFLNGEEIFSENEFKQKVDYLEKPIAVKKVNELKVVLKSGDFKVPAFLLIEVLGKNCDVTPPVISNPLPMDGALLNRARPGISINYSDSEEGASGIDADSVRLMVDGRDVTASATVGASGVRYTPPADLPEGDHTAFIAVSDGAANFSEYRWSFTTDTIAPVISIDSHVDGVWLKTPKITVGGSYTDERGEVPSFTINGAAAAATSDSYRLAVSLKEGANRFNVVATDPAGNSSTAAVTINLDTVAPTLSDAAPADAALLNNAHPTISAAYADETGGSGLNLDTLVLTVDGRTVTTDATVGAGGVLYAPANALPEGDHPVVASISDIAGNRSELRWNFTTDTIAPVIAIDSYADGAWINTPSIDLAGSWTDERGEAPRVTVNGETASVTDGRFSLPVSLGEGGNGFTAIATDAAGNSSSVAMSINLDTVPPVVTIAGPADSVWVNTLSIPVSGSLSEEFTQVTINGQSTDVTGSSFAASAVALTEEGANPIEVVAVDRAGNQGRAAITVNRDTIPPVVTVTSHGDGDWLNSPTITLGGTLSEAYAEMTINGAAASVVGSTFSLSGIALSEGANTLSVTAVDRAGNSGSASLSLNLDTVPPTVVIDAPATGSLTKLTTTEIAAHADEPILSAEVNGTAATLGDNGRFSIKAFPLNVEGDNVLTATVRDRAGNSGSASVTVERDTIPPQPPVLDALTTPTNVADTVVAGSAEPLSTIRVFQLSPTDSAPQLLAAVPCDAGGRFSLGGIVLTEGVSTFSADATDAAGNRGELSANLAVTLDTVPPVVTIKSPQEGAWFNTSDVTVSGSVDEALKSLTLSGQTVTLTDLTFSASAQLAADGPHNLVVTAVDLAGNSGSSSVTVNRDTVPPVVTVSAPADGLLTKAGSVALSGSVNEAVTAISVNDLDALLVGTDFSLDPVALTEGANPLTVTAVDRAGNSGSAIITVQRDSTPPAAPILSQPATPTNATVTTLSGRCEAGASVAVTLQQPDGAKSTLATLTAVDQDGDGEGDFTLGDIALGADGTFVLSAVATDAAGNSSPAASVTVVRDTVAPVITVTAPADNSVNEIQDVRIVGSLDDPSAALTIDGQAVTLNEGSFDYPLTLDFGENGVILMAQDAAGNSVVAGLTLFVDSTPPVVTIESPQPGLLTGDSQVTVRGSVNEPITQLSLNGSAVSFEGQSFEISAPLVGGANTLTVSATDRAGNVGSASVAVTSDTQPPLVTLSAPAEAAAGSNVQVTVTASDDLDLDLVEIAASGIPLWSGSLETISFSRTVTYSLAPGLAPGTAVTLRAEAVDKVGNRGSATAQILVNQAAQGPGFLQGEAYDDSRGLRLGGVQVDVYGASEKVASALTGEDGGYFFELPAGSYLIRLTREGYTAVERQAVIAPDLNSRALDARLTPLATAGTQLDLTGGEIVKTLSPDGSAYPALTLSVPDGALADAVDLRLTPVGNQGLAGPLPVGWSPLAAAEAHAYLPGTDLPAEDSFSSPATLTLAWTDGESLAADAGALLARYDAAAHRWTVSSAVTLGSAGRSVSAPLQDSGQYALLVPDAAAAPAAGQPLPGGVASPLDSAGILAQGKVVPAFAPPSVDLSAVAEVTLRAAEGSDPSPVSGTVVYGRMTERFEMFSGEVVQPAGFEQDLVLFRRPCLTNVGLGALDQGDGILLRATFPLTPSRSYTIVELLAGKVGVDILAAEEREDAGVMVGSDGARLVDADGNVLEIAAGSLGQTVPVSTRTVGQSTASALVGDDFTLLRAVEVDLTRQSLSASATLTIPAPAGFDPALPVVVARPVEVGSVLRLRLVALGRAAGSMIASDGMLSGLSLSGITTSGTYYFLQAKAPLGFLRGIVRGDGSASYVSALVTADSSSLADVTGADGRYLLAAPAGETAVTAFDPALRDSGSGSATLSAGAIADLDLTIVPRPPKVLSVSPADGAGGVEPSASVVVTFSEPIDRATVGDQTIVLKDASGNAVPGAFSFSPDGAVVTLYPAAALKSETLHTLTVGSAIRDLQGYTLAQAVTSTFTVRDTTPPQPPPAGSITATFPDEEGMITVTATQGSAEADCTVLVINDTTGEIVAVSPQTNGSFTARISAQLGDEIQVVLMDAAGNQTLISYLTFKAPDGRYLVTAKGGKVEGEGGLLLDIPEGALVGPAVVKITPVLESALPHPVPAEGKFLAAVNVDTGGIPFQKEIHLSIPVPENLPEGAVPFLAQPKVHMNPDGTEEEVYAVIDSTKIVNGRLTTASPPFAGPTGFGIFSFLFTPVPLEGPVIVSGTTYRDMDGLGGYMAGVDQPIRGAVIRNPGAQNFIAYSDANGHYASYGFTARDVCRNFAVTAIHPQTMFRNTANITTCDAPYIVNNLNFKLADKDTQVPDQSPPVIELGIQVAPSQEVRMSGGSVPVGTRLQVDLSVIDQSIKTVFLTAVHQNEMTGEQSYSIPVGEGTSTLYLPKDGEIPALFRNTYQPRFTSPLGEGAVFQLNSPGFYSLMVEATDEAGNTVKQTRQIRAVAPGAIPTALDGPPFVITTTPGGEATEVRVDTSVRAVFSEMVENVTESTFQLIDTVTGQPVPAIVTSGAEEGIMQAILLPRGNLNFGRRYEIVLSQEITDTGANPSAEGQPLPLAVEIRTAFTTQSPRAYDLVEGTFDDGRAIDLYFDARNRKMYSYVTTGSSGWRIADVTDPTKSRIVYPAADYSFPTGYSYRGVAVDQDNGRLAITENIVRGGEQFGYVRFYDLTENPAAPALIAQEKLAEAFSAIPGRLALNGNYAYIASVNAGLQVVDIEAAIEFRKTGKMSDGSSIVGAFDSVGQGFGSPYDIFIYKKNRAVLATNRGYFVTLDLTIPQFPRLVTAFRPEGTEWRGRAGLAADYVYEDAGGAVKAIDLLVGGTRDGKLRTADFTDPANPRLLGVATDDTGAEVNTFVNAVAINRVNGLAFVTTFNSIQIFDIKDPSRPKLLSTITEVPDGNGNMVPIGSLSDLTEHNGWVYLASQAKGMRTLNLAGEEGIPYNCDDCYLIGGGR